MLTHQTPSYPTYSWRFYVDTSLQKDAGYHPPVLVILIPSDLLVAV